MLSYTITWLSEVPGSVLIVARVGDGGAALVSVGALVGGGTLVGGGRFKTGAGLTLCLWLTVILLSIRVTLDLSCKW